MLQRTSESQQRLVEILIIEDDTVILNTLSYNLERQGFGVHTATTGAEALRAARKLRPNLILLDLMLPEESGIQVCQKIREHYQEVVIVMITARDVEENKLLGFKAGADDYVTKPFGMKKLSARIKANLKRSLASSASPRGKVLEYGNLWLDKKDFTARLEGEPLNLRLMEFKILAALASQPGALNTPTPTVTRRRHPGHQKSVRLEAYGQNRAGSWLWSSWVYWFYSCYGSEATRAEDAHIASGLAQVSRDRCPLQSLAGVAP